MKKRIIPLLLAIIMIMAIAACGGGDGGSQTQDPVTGGEDVGVEDAGGEDAVPAGPRFFDGREFLIGDWWTANNAPKMPPQNLRDEQFEDYQYFLEEEYGFTMRNWGVSGWADYLEIFTTATMAGTHEVDLYTMSSSWAYLLMSQGLLYPLDTLDSIDVHDDKWNSAITEGFTDGEGHVYALTSVKHVEPRNFLFFNKRLLQEAGIDPDEPYELQASGEWTWDKLLEYCEKLSIDTDGDGIIDKYALTGHWPNVQSGFIFSNNARHVGINPDGSFYNAMTEPSFERAMQFVQDLYDQGYYYYSPDPEDWWDWFNTGFNDAHAAMLIYEVFATPFDLEDEWGMVFVPKGPDATDYKTYFSENVFVLPFNLSKEEAEDIVYAWNLFTEPMPYDLDPNAWKDGGWGYQRFADSRAVDDTLAMLYEGRMEQDSKTFIDPGDHWWGRTYDWNAVQNQDASVAEKILAAKPVVDARINEVNSK